MFIVDGISTAIALRVKDGVVIAVEKIITSKMLEEGSNSRINAVDLHIAMVNFLMTNNLKQ
jgi:20S proteasome subunit alpha 7